MKFCTNCRAQLEDDVIFCTYCGTQDPNMVSSVQNESVPKSRIQSGSQKIVNYEGPVKYRLAAAIFAFILGTFGIHKFYMNKTGQGIIYLIFFWSGVPTVLGIIDGIMYLTDKEETFNQRLTSPLSNPPKQLNRDRIMAVVLAITFGCVGAQRFFLKDPKAFWHVIFFWTGIPAIIGIIEGIIMACESDINFSRRYYY